MMKVKLIFY